MQAFLAFASGFCRRRPSFAKRTLWVRQASAWLLACAVLFFSHSAFAWIETAVRSHQAHVVVSPDGTAEVRQDLVLKIRGGPLEALEIAGVGDEVEPLPDASVRRARRGSGSVWPIEQIPSQDGGLRLKVQGKRGLRGGSYRFLFAYRIDLADRGWIEPGDEGTVVTWVGPRLSTGVDSAKVVFEIPRAENPPALPEVEEGPAKAVLLGQVRRGAKTDQIELVRAHLATAEPAVWKIRVDSEALSAVSVPQQKALASPSLNLPLQSERQPLMPWWQWAVVSLCAFVFGGLSWLKGHAVNKAARTRQARPRPLIPAPLPVRVVVSTAAAGACCYLIIETLPVLAAAMALGVAASSTYMFPARIQKPRGPGRWEELGVDQLPTKRQQPAGRAFELGHWAGLVCFVILNAALVFLAFRLLPTSTYLALMTGLGHLCLLPLFMTGRSKDLPRTPIEQAMPWYDYLRRAFDARTVRTELWGRQPVAGDTVAHPSMDSCDEVRVRLIPDRVPAGLRSLEVSLDEMVGAHVVPCVVVRALEDSPALRRLPSDIPWRRGRVPEERVALLHPAAPSRSQLLRLLRSLVNSIRYDSSGISLAPGSNSSSSDGSSDSASKLGSPAVSAAM